MLHCARLILVVALIPCTADALTLLEGAHTISAAYPFEGLQAFRNADVLVTEGAEFCTGIPTNPDLDLPQGVSVELASASLVFEGGQIDCPVWSFTEIRGGNFRVVDATTASGAITGGVFETLQILPGFAQGNDFRMLGGTVTGDALLFDTVPIKGGTFLGTVFLYGTDIDGGTFEGDVLAQRPPVVLTGGDIRGRLVLVDVPFNDLVVIAETARHERDVYGPFSDRIWGTWQDGSSFDIQVDRPSNAEIQIQSMPEPRAMVYAVAALAALAIRHRGA